MPDKITTANYQALQKVAEEEYLLLHPETDAEVVKLAAEGITADNVKDALLEIKAKVEAAIAGGVTSVNGKSGEVTITKEDIELGKVDNTSDLEKPISTKTQAALNLKANTADLGELATKDALTATEVGLGNVTNDAQVKRTEMGKANGVATLDGTGKVPAAQLPGFVDDVESYANRTSFPETGEDGKIYIDKETNKQYRWDGESDYVEISSSLALGESASTAYAGNRGKANADAIAALQTRAETIESKNTEQDTAIAKAQGDATAAKTAAEAAQEDADANATEISNIKNGTTKVGKAGVADSATSATSATTATKLAKGQNFSIEGDVTAEAKSFDGSSAVVLNTTLKNSGVKAGSYSAVTVNAKGIVTAGANVIEIGEDGQAAPSANLAIGGIFFKKV